MDRRDTAPAPPFSTAVNMAAQLMGLMRHETIETTVSYYVGRNAERTTAILWHEHEKATAPEQKAEAKKPRARRGRTST